MPLTTVPFATTLRSLRRSRGLAVAVIATLATGVGAVTTTFAVVNAAIWRQPPFPQADRLAVLYLVRNPRGEPQRRERWSFARAQLLGQSQHSFENIATVSLASVTLAGDAGSESLRGEMVSASYFETMRVVALRGRVFTPDEDDPANPSGVVVVSKAFAGRHWPDQPSVLGRTLRVNAEPLVVIGVLPGGFRGVTGQADLWFPATLAPRLTYGDYVRTNQNFISVVARLRPNATLGQARSELAVLGAVINRALPSDPSQPDEQVTATALSLNEARADRTVRRSVLVLFGAVALLHLLACANVVNLLLGRAASRRRESAVRVALGGGARRLFAHILAEGIALGAVGALLGVAAAWWATPVLSPPANVWAPRNFYGAVGTFDSPGFGTAEAAFGFALGIATSVLVALPPAVTAFRLDVASGLKAGARGMSDGAFSLRRPTVRGLIVGLEAALAMVLVVAAGLLVESYRHMRQKDLGLGVDPERVLTFWVIPSEARVPPSTAPQFVARLVDAMQRVPGVQSVSVDGGAPLAGTASSTMYVMGRPAPAPGQAPPVLRHYVAPAHFALLGIPVVRGRVFTPSDIAGAPKVTVISQTAAQRFWPNEDPIGRRVWFGGGSSFSSADSSAEIVGIVGDVVYAPLDQRPNLASFYTAFAQFTYASRVVYVRSDRDLATLTSEVRRALAGVDPDVAMRDVQPLAAIVNGSWARNRFDAILFGGFGIAALLLAASGTFAVLAYAVANRTREFGIRVALGANRANVVRLVLRDGLALPAIGLVVGLAGSIATTRMLRNALFEVSPLEPRVFVIAIALLLAVAAAACVVPALRATHSDPLDALRAD